MGTTKKVADQIKLAENVTNRLLSNLDQADQSLHRLNQALSVRTVLYSGHGLIRVIIQTVRKCDQCGRALPNDEAGNFCNKQCRADAYK